MPSLSPTRLASAVLALGVAASPARVHADAGVPAVDFSCTSSSSLTLACTDRSSESGGTIVSHSWNFGDGGTSTATNPSHTYAASGTYTVTETVVDASARSASKSAAFTVGLIIESPDLIRNGTFESGSATPWTLSSGILCTNATCSGETAHAGTGFLWLDGYGAVHTDAASQKVAIPKGYAHYPLTFWLHIDTRETGSTPYDTLKVQVLDGTTNAVLATLATYSNANAGIGFQQKTLDMGAFAGRTVTIRFLGTEDSSNATSFVLDDVAFRIY